MRIAVLSDIHGNVVALEAVLKDLIRQGAFDQVIVAGDFFAPGPDTTAVLDALRQLPHARFLAGNADRYLLDGSYATVYDADGWQGQLRRAFRWTLERLQGSEWRFLASLPFKQVVRAGERKLLAVHGSPRSDEEGLTADTRADEFNQMPIEPQVSLISCGHTHIPVDRIINGVRVVNAGSVGLPFDGDPRPGYAIISNLEARTPEGISVELRRVDYDVEQAVQQLYAVNHPAADLGAYNLRHGRPSGNTNIYQVKSCPALQVASVQA